MLTLTHGVVRALNCFHKPTEEHDNDYDVVMKTKVIHALTFASPGSRQRTGHNVVFNRTLYTLLSQQSMLRIRGAFKSITQCSLTPQPVLAGTRKREAAHLQYRSVSNPQTPASAPKELDIWALNLVQRVGG